jgi:hypothetical protein
VVPYCCNATNFLVKQNVPQIAVLLYLQQELLTKYKTFDFNSSQAQQIYMQDF